MSDIDVMFKFLILKHFTVHFVVIVSILKIYLKMRSVTSFLFQMVLIIVELVTFVPFNESIVIFYREV